MKIMINFQLSKLKILRNRLRYYEEEKNNILLDIEMVKKMKKDCPISIKRVNKLIKSIEKVNLYKMRIENIIDTIDDEIDKNILYLKYIKGLTIEKISDTLNYSKSSIYYRIAKYNERC